MRFYLAFVTMAVLGLGAGTGCSREDKAAQPAPKPATASQRDPDLLARLHFSGTTHLLADKKAAAKLNEIAALPETAALENETLGKLATTPYRYLHESHLLPDGAASHAALIRPLVDDLIHNESYTELRGPTNPVPELILAVRLSADHAALWHTNLSKVLATWTGLPIREIQVQGYPGWELTKHQPPNLVRFVQAGDWTIFSWGQNDIKGLSGLLQRIKSSKSPAAPMPDHWLEAWADCGRLFSKWHAGVPFEFPEIELNEGLKDDNVRTTSILRFKDSLQTNLPKWNIPTNLIGYPLIDFIAARDIAPLLKKYQFVQNLKLDPLPDQFSCWSEYATPFGKILALPMANSSNFVSQLGARLVSLENTNLQSHRWGEFGWDEEHSAFEWKGLPPIVFPHMIPVSGTNGEYALLKLFPNKPRPSKARPELFAEVFGKPNLVYYEWEITSEHLGQWWNLLSLYSALRRVPVGDAEAPAFKWINAMAKRAGNTVTEAVITGPRELTLTRKSPLGFTGTELALFLRQENGPGFPLHSVDEIETIVIPSGGAQFIPANGGRPAAAPGH